MLTVVLGQKANIKPSGTILCKVTWWSPQWLGWGRCGGGCGSWDGVSREGTCSEAHHRGGHHGMTPGSGRVKGLICKAILIKLSCSGIPPVRGVIWWVISARFCDLVLEGGVETTAELQDNCEGIQVSWWEVDKVLKLVNICINCLLALEIVVRFKAHEGMGWLIPWAESLNENSPEGLLCCIAWDVILHLILDNAISKGHSTVTFHVGQDPMDLGLVIMELCSA